MRGLGWFVALTLLGVPIGARAFCGFYVAGADHAITNQATMVVMMREGTTTVLSMQNDYHGPPEDFALVVPVPVVLQEENVRTLPRELFERVDRLASPRLVEYWEQDPCRPAYEGTIGLGNLGTIGHGGGGYGRGGGSAPEVVVEAEFAVGEYEIVILSARDSDALETWLRANDYRIPEGSAAVLRPYVESGMRFFVARVDASRVTFEEGRAVLSPLRVHYDSEAFSLPVRLGLLNSSGTQDLVVHVLARNQRYEVANYPNATIPTNLDVNAGARERFGEFYAALFDATLEQHPGAVVTEYAWQASTCDPCPGPTLSNEDLATLGADVAPPTAETPPDPMFGLGGFGGGQRSGPVPQVRFSAPNVHGSLSREVVRRVLRRHLNEVRFCYEQQLHQVPDLNGRMTVAFTIGTTGAVQSSEMQTSTLENDALEGCVTSAVRRWAFPRPDDDGVVNVTQAIVLSVRGAGGRSTVVRASPYRSFVLSRLHYRYGRDGLDEDLVFRAASAVEGGRERRADDGALEEGATDAPINNFQARYAIRHAWEGAVECEQPNRGIWGGPRNGLRPEPAAAQNTAAETRGEIQLASVLTEPLPALGVTTVRPPEPTEESVPSSDPAAAPEADVERAETDGPGCGCRLIGSQAGGVSAPTERVSGLALVFLTGCLFIRRRRSF